MAKADNCGFKTLDLERLKKLTKLRVLDLTENPLTEDVKRELQKAMPFAMI